MDFHTGRRMAKACWAFLILALMSSSVPPVLLILLPRYTNSLTSSTAVPSIVTGASCWLLVRNSFVLSWLILRPTCFAALLRALTLSCKSCRRCDSRAKSSLGMSTGCPFQNLRRLSASLSPAPQGIGAVTACSLV